jgi:hypothetical protein
MSNPHPTSTTTSTRSNLLGRKWFIDLQIRKNERLALAIITTTGVANNTPLALPVGFSEHKLPDVTAAEDDDRLIARRSWDIALQPIKQLPMNMILSWMAGNSFSLMSIMIVVMLFMKPIQVNSSKFFFFLNLFFILFFSQCFLLVQHLHH